MDFQLKRDGNGEYYVTTPGPIERMVAKSGNIHEIMETRTALRQEWDGMGAQARRREGDSWLKFFKENMEEALKYHDR